MPERPGIKSLTYRYHLGSGLGAITLCIGEKRRCKLYDGIGNSGDRMVHWTIRGKAIGAIENLVEERRIFSLRDSYENMDWTDAAYSELKLVLHDGRRKRISCYYGDNTAPDSIKKFDEKLLRLISGCEPYAKEILKMYL